jgi:anti-anti-sigma factor
MPEPGRRERDGIVIFDLAGRLTDSPLLLHTEVADALAKGCLGVVLNLAEVSYVNSVFLGAIIQLFVKLSRAGGQLKLLNVPSVVMRMLVVTRLSSVFDVFTEEEDAVNSFFPDRPLRYPHMLHEQTLPPQVREESRPRLSVFLCHSSGDKPDVRTLYHRLVAAGAKPWLDEMDLLPGQVWEREIPAACAGATLSLVCLSAGSVGKTGYLQREIKHALDAADEQSDDSIFLIPGRLEPCEVPERLRRCQWVDLFAGDGYDRLLTALQARALALGRSRIQPEQR